MSLERMQGSVARLEFQMELLQELVDPDRNAFTYLIFKSGLSRKQYDDVMEYLNTLNARLAKNLPISGPEYVTQINLRAHHLRREDKFPERLISTLEDSELYQTLCVELKKQGIIL